jgi:RNA polymerase sigma-70 factor (ECF subfamily)
MPETSVSLLERLRLHPDAPAWQRLVDLYTPLIRAWLQRYGVQPADADDLVQEVMGVLIRELPGFEHERRTGSFRRWLRSITVNRLRAFWRARRGRPISVGGSDFGRLLSELEDPESGLSRDWDVEHDCHVARRLLELIESEFEPATWQAFHMLVMEGKPTAAVAAKLGVSANSVRIAKSRVLSRLRQEMHGLVE